MNHLTDVINTINAYDINDIVMATVVEVEGSAYRQPGARMLILANGQSVGMVSGGCLERHLVQRAFWLTGHGPCLQTYHTATDITSSDDFDDEFQEQEGFGLGCQGTIKVLFERLSIPTADYMLRRLNELMVTNKNYPLATIIASDEATIPLGLHFHPKTTRNILGQGWELQQTALAGRKSNFYIKTYQKNDLTIRVLEEVLSPALHLVIFGAGQDCLPLIQIAKIQGWFVTVVDSRADYINTLQRSSQADQACHIPLERAYNIQSLLGQDRAIAVAVMTHSVTQDRTWLMQILTTKPAPFYVGQLGPRYRTEELLADIKQSLATNSAVNDINVQHLHYPMGISIGGDTPEAVALSIVAQIQAEYSVYLKAQTVAL